MRWPRTARERLSDVRSSRRAMRGRLPALRVESPAWCVLREVREVERELASGDDPRSFWLNERFGS